MPSALAVLRLMTNSNLVGCTDRKIGWAGTLEYLAGIHAHLPIGVWDAGAVARQIAGGRHIPARW